MTITVKGERYGSFDELYDSIVQLTMTLESMSSESPEHNSLASHIEDLKAELPQDFTPSPPDDSPATSVATPEEGDEGGEELPEEVTTNIRDAYEQGLDVVCPTCGQPVDMPEAPPHDPNVETCPSCKGWGMAVTGSRVDGHIWRNCSTCDGQGWVTKTTAIPQSFHSGAADVPQAPGATLNAITSRWDPPAGQQPPWVGAQWDNLLGKWG